MSFLFAESLPACLFVNEYSNSNLIFTNLNHDENVILFVIFDAVGSMLFCRQEVIHS